MKPTIVVTDASPLIALAVMDLLPVLRKIFNTVMAPPAVVRECLEDLSKPMADSIAEAFTNRLLVEQSVTDRDYCDLLTEILDPGEAETIALAKEKNAVALIDDAAGRKVAARENIKVTGSLYVLIRAKQEKLIPEATSRLNRLVEHGYHLDESLVRFVIDACDETIDEGEQRQRGN